MREINTKLVKIKNDPQNNKVDTKIYGAINKISRHISKQYFKNMEKPTAACTSRIIIWGRVAQILTKTVFIFLIHDWTILRWLLMSFAERE